MAWLVAPGKYTHASGVARAGVAGSRGEEAGAGRGRGLSHGARGPFKGGPAHVPRDARAGSV